MSQVCTTGGHIVPNLGKDFIILEIILDTLVFIKRKALCNKYYLWQIYGAKIILMMKKRIEIRL